MRLFSPRFRRPTVRRRRRIRWKFLSRDCLAAIKTAILSHCQKPVRSCTSLQQLLFIIVAAFLSVLHSEKKVIYRYFFHEARNEASCKEYVTVLFIFITLLKNVHNYAHDKLLVWTFFSDTVRITGQFLRSWKHMLKYALKNTQMLPHLSI